jgi:hypothetical protein
VLLAPAHALSLAADRRIGSASEKATSPLKNRVWGFCRRPSETHREKRTQVGGSHQVARRPSAKVASGRRHFLSPDPLGHASDMSLYGFANGDPVNYFDPDGREIFLESHPVAFGMNHSKVTVIPNNQAKWANDPNFSNTLPDGRHYATFGAGPEGYNPQGGNNLVSNLNRPRDLIRDKNKSSARLKCPKKSEDDSIKDLFDADAKYNDAALYDFIPPSWADGYNSNSYAHGLLNAVGFKNIPTPPSAPGFGKPLPPSSFGK